MTVQLEKAQTVWLVWIGCFSQEKRTWQNNLSLQSLSEQITRRLE